jgi:hypothetical protein
MDWVSPPTPGRDGRSQFYDDVAWELKQNAGKWARVLANSQVAHVGRLPLRNRGCQTTSRKNGAGGWDLYAMHPGD